MNLVTTEEAAARNERLREAPRRHCAVCGTRLNRYAAASRVLCTLCLQHDTEARLVFAARLRAALLATADPETGECSPVYYRRLGAIKADALHAALWRLAFATPPEGLQMLGVDDHRLEDLPNPPRGGRLLVLSHQRLLNVYGEGREFLNARCLMRLRRDRHLQRLGHAVWDEGVSTFYEVWSIRPRRYDQLGNPARLPDLLPARRPR